MFSGIVQALGSILEYQSCDPGLKLLVSPGKLVLSDIQLGESIAHNGVCLTVTGKNSTGYWVELSAETLETTVGFALSSSSTFINLERALTLSSLVGGHLVSGHIDGICRVSNVQVVGNCKKLTLEAPVELAPYIARKGSIAVNGVSLTVNTVQDCLFSVNLIPYTLENTMLFSVSEQSLLNIEVDLVARYLERLASFSATTNSLLYS